MPTLTRRKPKSKLTQISMHSYIYVAIHTCTNSHCKQKMELDVDLQKCQSDLVLSNFGQLNVMQRKEAVMRVATHKTTCMQYMQREGTSSVQHSVKSIYRCYASLCLVEKLCYIQIWFLQYKLQHYYFVCRHIVCAPNPCCYFCNSSVLGEG